MTNEEKRAYDWALHQNYQSVAAKNAKTLAELVRKTLSVKSGDPLTPEQLMKMDGQPIWIEHDEDPKYNHVWMIWNNEIGMRHNLAGYNIFWRAYAYPHAHIDRDAWEPCGECEKRNCDNCLYSEYLSSMEPCKSCYNAKKWKPVSRFCGNCGRPLTPEAWDELEKRLRGLQNG